MQKEKLYFMNCNLAGRMYHEADEVWNKLSVGTRLRLERDVENRYDPKAVAVLYDNPETDEPTLMGYIPAEKNFNLSIFLDMGWKMMRVNEGKYLEHYNAQKMTLCGQ